MRKISNGGYSKYATAVQSAITKGSPLLHFFCERTVFSSQVKEKKGAGRKCALKGRKEEEEEEEEIMTAVRPLFPARVGGEGRRKGWKRTTNSKSAKVEAGKREEKERREGSRAASPPKKSGVNRGWRKESPSFSRRIR